MFEPLLGPSNIQAFALNMPNSLIFFFRQISKELLRRNDSWNSFNVFGLILLKTSIDILRRKSHFEPFGNLLGNAHCKIDGNIRMLQDFLAGKYYSCKVLTEALLLTSSLQQSKVPSSMFFAWGSKIFTGVFLVMMSDGLSSDLTNLTSISPFACMSLIK